jgi:hypothetical protein
MSDVIVIKLDTSGNLTSIKILETTKEEHGNFIAVNKSDNIYKFIKDS